MDKIFTLNADTLLKWTADYIKSGNAPLWLVAFATYVGQFKGKKIEISIRAVEK
jgi:hypothetical protein